MKNDTKNMSNKHSGSQHESDCTNTPAVSLSRRSVLLTMTAGTVSTSIAAKPVAANGNNNGVSVDIDDAYGGNPTGVPENIVINAGSTVDFTTTDIQDGAIITFTIGVRPKNGGSFHEIGDGSFEVNSSGNYYTEEDGEEIHRVPLSIVPDEGRNLFSDPRLNPQEDGLSFWNEHGFNDPYEVELSELEDEDKRYVSKDIEIQVGAEVHGSDETFEPDEKEFTINFARTGGLGVNLGYSLGRKWPVDGPSHPDFESNA